MIVLMGPAGAGKSLQGHALADEYGYAYLSTGELFRVLITGRRRHEMLEGKLLSDDEVIKTVDRALEIIDTSQEFVLDGFPRTKAQVDWLVGQYKAGRFDRPVVINLEIEEGVIRERLEKRARPDDTDEAITRRFAEYQSVTRPILSYLTEKGIVIHDINAAQLPERVRADISAALGLSEA
jgi:adenylate kinase